MCRTPARQKNGIRGKFMRKKSHPSDTQWTQRVIAFLLEDRAASRELFRLEYSRLTSAVRSASEPDQRAIGAAIREAYGDFVHRFDTTHAFVHLSEDRRQPYLDMLEALVVALQRDNPAAAIGTGLFRLWVAAVAEEDGDLRNQFARELVYLSNKGLSIDAHRIEFES
jgi:hypothetical protein